MIMAPKPAETERAPKHGINPGEQIDYEVTPSSVALLERLGCSLGISNYHSSTVMCLSSLGGGPPAQMFPRLPAAMGFRNLPIEHAPAFTPVPLRARSGQ